MESKAIDAGSGVGAILSITPDPERSNTPLNMFLVPPPVNVPL